MQLLRSVTIGVVSAIGAASLSTGVALAAAQTACSKTVDNTTYACISVKSDKVPSGDTVKFTGTLSPAAMKNLQNWTAGDNIVCLDRFKPAAESDGSWPWQTLEGACTTVKKNGKWTINAEFGRKGTFYYGLEMGPCRADKSTCGDGDPILVGVNVDKDKRTVKVTTS